MVFDDFFEYLDGLDFSLLVVAGVFLALGIRHWTSRWFLRVGSQIGELPAKCALNGREVALRLLAASGLGHVAVKREGPTNCYHPWKREVRLRPETHDSVSLSALATAAHEVGHAQHFSEKVWRCRLRNILWPVCWAMPALAAIYAILCFLGIIHFSETMIVQVILLTCAVSLILQLPISLPLERDASERAKNLVRDEGLLAEYEYAGFDRLLSAAWKTHASAEVQRWIVFTSIVLAAAGYLWYWSLEEQYLAQIQAYQATLPAEVYVPEVAAPPNPATLPGDRPMVVVLEGWENILWLIPLSPFLLVIGFIVMTFMAKPKQPTAGKQTAEETAVLHNNSATALHAEGKHEAAIEEYSRALQLNPRFTLAWFNRGQLYFSQEDFEEAAGDFDTAARLAPHYLSAVAARGHARLLLGQDQQGLADLETVLAHDSANAEALITRAEYWFCREEYERAIPDWTEAINADPACGDLYRARGLSYYFLKDYDRAVIEQTEAIRLDPSDAIALNNRGAALLQRGDWSESAEDLCKAIELNPKMPNSYRHLAWLQATCPAAEYRDGSAAVANATRALELTEWQQSEWFDVLAAAHAEAGNFDEAVCWQQKCLDESPAETKAELNARLAMYETAQPFRATAEGQVTQAG